MLSQIDTFAGDQFVYSVRTSGGVGSGWDFNIQPNLTLYPTEHRDRYTFLGRDANTGDTGRLRLGLNGIISPESGITGSWDLSRGEWPHFGLHQNGMFGTPIIRLYGVGSYSIWNWPEGIDTSGYYEASRFADYRYTTQDVYCIDLTISKANGTMFSYPWKPHTWSLSFVYLNWYDRFRIKTKFGYLYIPKMYYVDIRELRAKLADKFDLTSPDRYDKDVILSYLWKNVDTFRWYLQSSSSNYSYFTKPQFVEGTQTDNTLKDVSRKLTSFFSSDIPTLVQLDEELKYPSDIRIKFGQVLGDAVSNSRALEINTGMWFKEFLSLITHPTDTFLGWIDTLPKSISNLYLTWHYGLRLTIKDFRTMVSSLLERYCSNYYQHDKVSVSSSLTTEWRDITIGDVPFKVRETYACKIYYSPISLESVENATALLRDWDLFPTFANLWDMIPYSFVIDWFTNLGDLFSALDSQLMATELPLIGCTYTWEREWQCQNVEGMEKMLQLPSMGGSISCKYYKRTCKDFLIPVMPKWEIPSDFTTWLEAAALIVQRF